MSIFNRGEPVLMPDKKINKRTIDRYYVATAQ
jgi:hypothetical protein